MATPLDGRAAVRAAVRLKGCGRLGWQSLVENTAGQPNESTSTAFYIGAQKAISSCRLNCSDRAKVTALKVNGVTR